MIQMLLSATTALIAATAPLTYTVIQDESHLPLLNPDVAKRQTLKLRLANGLEALIISDPDADQSAASMCVDAGSWSDPIEYAGMAHFCEHMLFMGTKKYPTDNEFSTTVGNYGGTLNAFTAPNKTVYMFAAQTDGFLNIFDQFAHFFIDPLFNPANIARELYAVDQEFAKNIEHDAWREYMVFKETGNKAHPNCMFSTGNAQTLGNIPQSALKKWHAENYSADRMHLVVLSSLPMETLQNTVVQTLSQVPKSSMKAVDTSGTLSSSEQTGHITYIKPIQNRQTVTLSWELPLEFSIDPTKSADVLAYALNRGGKYSLYEKLKSEKLIDSLTIQVDELGGEAHRFFQISLDLTRQGVEKVDTAILRCFEALALLKTTAVPKYLYEEKNIMAQLNYQYQGRQTPFDYIMRLGQSVADEPLNTYPRQTLLASKYDPKKIGAVAKFLSPQTCSIAFLISPELTSIVPDKKEKWLGAEYAIRAIPESSLKTWVSAKPNEQIRLPDPNPFIPNNLSVGPAANSVPIQIANDDLGIAYYVRSAEFGSPSAIYHIHILSPEIASNAKSAALTYLYIDHVTDMLEPTLAAARAAGLSCTFDLDRSALHLQVAGYSEKAPLLLQEVAKQMPLTTPTPEQFAIYVDRHAKAYANGQKELAARQAKELLSSIINQDNITQKEKLKALQDISYEEFLHFHKKLFESIYIQALFAGNLSVKEAESAYLDVIHVLGKTPFPKRLHPQTKSLRLADAGPYEITQTTDVLGNATILTIDQGDFTYETRAVQELLAVALKEAFFNELRSKQKTGYIAQSDALEVQEHLFQYFLVQSNSHQPEDLLIRFEQFIEEFSDALGENIQLDRFETLKKSQIASLKTRFRNLRDKTVLWDRLAFEKDANFDFIEKRIQALNNLSYEEFQNISKGFISRTNRKRLAILFEGKLAAPFAYQPIDLSQIEKIVSYVPTVAKN